MLSHFFRVIYGGYIILCHYRTLIYEKIEKKAKSIAILPNHVRLQDVESSISSIESTPIGIVKESLEISTFNFNKICRFICRININICCILFNVNLQANRCKKIC